MKKYVRPQEIQIIFVGQITIPVESQETKNSVILHDSELQHILNDIAALEARVDRYVKQSNRKTIGSFRWMLFDRRSLPQSIYNSLLQAKGWAVTIQRRLNECITGSAEMS